ncbi:hypothetical protein DYB25_009300 [Aphanomyces astaci]|uniref:HTH CENPB-type domain-containing protein n=2 Tax=Aphanomyces astaci TaxID=112090 RepID=A0A397AJI6_APHAT|nr:hypothetical protein DYB25_009300 [Aphanomyces astaci]RHY37205.1 hypothetical protein DYB34_012763 [Aphanomyces astaci]RHY79264.1 hypothetical protein DYB31_009321 [Aphanomyces astaci]
MAPTQLDGRRTGGTKKIKRMPKKHKNLYHTYEKKLHHIVNWRKEHSMESAIDTCFPSVAGAKRTTVWKQILRSESQRDHITMACSKARTRDMRTLRKQGISTTLTRIAEENIAQWAMNVALEQGLEANQFKASPSWMKGLMKRWGLAIRANLADGEKARAEFKTSIRKAFRLKCPERWDIVEWISYVWDELPATTIVKGFEKYQIIDPGTALVDHTQQDPEDSSGDDVLQDLCDTGVFEALDPEDDVSLTLAECID